MRILITGGTGFIGSALARELRDEGHDVIITTRQRSDSADRLTWNPPDLIPSEIISKIDAVINLAGEPIAPERWTEERKKRMMSSRVDTTRALVESMKNAGTRPKVLISASAVGYYGPHGDEVITEDSPPASDFLAGVCRAWEEEALKAEESGARVVLVRIGGVLEKDGGILKQMTAQFNFMMGGPVGDGTQWFSWIHRDDIVGIIKFALLNDSISGPVNGTAPAPVTNLTFSTALGKAMKRPSYVSIPAFVIKMALGELADVLLTGQRVVPEKALKAGYEFKHPEIKEALKTIFAK